VKVDFSNPVDLPFRLQNLPLILLRKSAGANTTVRLMVPLRTVIAHSLAGNGGSLRRRSAALRSTAHAARPARRERRLRIDMSLTATRLRQLRLAVGVDNRISRLEDPLSARTCALYQPEVQLSQFPHFSFAPQGLGCQCPQGKGTRVAGGNDHFELGLLEGAD
jgi:hypothetical protein